MDRLRDKAVEIVDFMEGCTVEFAADPAWHRSRYDSIEEMLKKMTEDSEIERVAKEVTQGEMHDLLGFSRPGTGEPPSEYDVMFTRKIIEGLFK